MRRENLSRRPPGVYIWQVPLLGFSAAANHVKARENWKGWSPRQSACRLALVVNRGLFKRVVSAAAVRQPPWTRAKHGWTPRAEGTEAPSQRQALTLGLGLWAIDFRL